MKRYTLMVLILILALSGACAANTDAAAPATTAASSETPRVTFAPWADYEDMLPGISISWAYYETLADLCEDAQSIIVGTVRDIDVVPKPEDEQTYDDENVRETVIKYNVEVSQALSGDQTVGETVSVWQSGWQYGDINVYHPDTPPLAYDKTYIMFLGENAYIENPIYPAFHFCVPFESYPEIADGIVLPHPRSRFFTKDMSAEDTIDMISKEVTQQNAPEQITAVQGVSGLIERAAFAPDQTPVRDLSNEEIQTVFDFAGNDFVLETAGKELENGDIFIWVKINKLEDAQQDSFYSTLETAVSPVAAERDAHFKVTCTPFHTMVSICLYNEDNATIHDAFKKVIDAQSDTGD